VTRRLLAAVAGFAVGYAIVDVPMVLLGSAHKAADRRRRAAEWTEIERQLLRDQYVTAETRRQELEVELERVRAVAVDAVSGYTFPGHPGFHARRSGWVPVATVERWHKALER
jgi:hypothetical protein